ncbi:hypothetical protein B0T16DRAFT_385469 [Cercophora newfieldiana]|uniref:Uncharacterized protein n=1 Tax=Cercophora newfieldiana TaxID=92897 RepID=A0AA39YRM3_9PEZI|nr:hypothetical protein B0T16DRAFT_385469 [Cercophora newfieldiana]
MLLLSTQLGSCARTHSGEKADSGREMLDIADLTRDPCLIGARRQVLGAHKDADGATVKTRVFANFSSSKSTASLEAQRARMDMEPTNGVAPRALNGHRTVDTKQWDFECDGAAAAPQAAAKQVRGMEKILTHAGIPFVRVQQLLPLRQSAKYGYASVMMEKLPRLKPKSEDIDYRFLVDPSSWEKRPTSQRSRCTRCASPGCRIPAQWGVSRLVVLLLIPGPSCSLKARE